MSRSATQELAVFLPVAGYSETYAELKTVVHLARDAGDPHGRLESLVQILSSRPFFGSPVAFQLHTDPAVPSSARWPRLLLRQERLSLRQKP